MTPLRYVVLRHEGVPQPHYDLMFETVPGSALATWRSSEWPISSNAIIEKLGDHRRDYLDYEGPVSNNRGHVRRVAAGTHVIEQTLPSFVTRIDNTTRLELPM